MVSSIGSRLVPGDLGASAAGRAAAPSSTAAPVADNANAQQQAAQTSGTASTLAKSMATEAPVDTDRVAQIKDAIAKGTFPIVPAKIADRLIASKLEWMSDAKA